MINDGRRPATFTPLRGDSWDEEIAREGKAKQRRELFRFVIVIIIVIVIEYEYVYGHEYA